MKPTAQELTRSGQWLAENFGPTTAIKASSPGHGHHAGAIPPFSFAYGGKPSQELLDRWEFQETSAIVDETRTRRTQTYRDQTSGLTVRCEIVQYQDYPMVEWTLYFKNVGTNDTAIVENIQALDARFKRPASSEFLLHHHVGSPCSARDYAPLETRLGPGQTKRISAAGGRPTNSDWSYFNLDWGSRGVILAVGWPGQWATEFVHDSDDGLRVRAGQERTHFKLHPGEEIRTPLIAIQFWEGGDWTRAQNVWRRWFIAHNLRKPGGKLPPIQWCGASETGTNLMVGATEQNQKTFVDAYLERGLKPDFWWMDAGWYPCQGDWTRTGTWEPDKARFPKGLRPVTDYLHARGIRAILWFEPERVTADTWLAKNHPEWILGGKGGGLLNLGHPEAWNWLVNHVDKLLTSEGIDIYRQDFNMDPLALWRANDPEDRQGITEIRHVTGLLAYWDELLRRHPDVLYDNCASGGRRNDLESMRRGVPYTKSDYAEDLVGVQCQTYGISFWLPYFAATWDTRDSSYPCRSRMAPVVGACLDGHNRDHFRTELPRRLEEWRKIVANYWGDFWPLAPYSLDNNVWMAWQFDCPESGQGVVQAFRRAETADESIRLRLRGLEPDAQYALADLDSGRLQQAGGRELAETGVLITATSRPSAPVVLYRKVR